MTSIAHLSDLHLLEDAHRERRGLARRRLGYLSFGRPKDAAARKKRATDALRRAKASLADHLVLTGDLTEDGTDEQFEVLAGVLHESGWAPSRVTLIPGNHDAYSGIAAWDRALAGPLRAYRDTSVESVPLYLPDVAILPLSTAFEQPYTRSEGAIAARSIHAALALASQTKLSEYAVVIAMHHPPRKMFAALHWIDGLRQHREVTAILEQHDHVHVLHGHTHVATDRPVREGATPRIHGVEAVVESASPLRLYKAHRGRLWPEVTSGTGRLALAFA